MPSASGGYELAAGAPAVAPQEQQAEEQQANDNPTANAEDLRGVEPTSVESDSTLRALQELAPTQLEYFIEAAAQGKELNYTEAARALGEDAPARIEAMHQDYLRAGQQLLSGLGVSDHLAFENWVRRTNPGLASTITRDVLVNKSMGTLAQAGRSYIAARSQALEQKLAGMKIETQRRDGELYVSRAALGLAEVPRRGDFGPIKFISVREAEKQGLLDIREV